MQKKFKNFGWKIFPPKNLPPPPKKILFFPRVPPSSLFLLPSPLSPFPFCPWPGHANGAKWDQMGQNGSKQVKIGNFAKIHENSLECGAPASNCPFSGHANGAKWVKMGQNGSKKVKIGQKRSKLEISLKSMKMHLILVPLLPSFPFSGHANGAKRNKMGKNSSKWVKMV